MNRIDGQVQGPYLIATDTICYGQITAGATVAQNVKFVLRGMITGDLVVEPRATVEIYGMVNGLLRNLGATVTVFGCVDEIEDLGEIKTVVREGGKVRGFCGGPRQTT